MHMQSTRRYQFIVQQSALGYIFAALFASNLSIFEGKRARRNTSQVTNKLIHRDATAKHPELHSLFLRQ